MAAQELCLVRTSSNFFPDFVGNESAPNDFSYNLLTNLGTLQGSNPIVRVGGSTQDFATFNSSQQEALIGIFDYKRSKDFPTTISIGPAFFESYNTWHDEISFIHGFNLPTARFVNHSLPISG